MKIIRTRSEIERFSKASKIAGKTIGFVPTMGFLHEGHMSLVRAARRENDVCVVSIFVNPTQFGPSEDFEAYPRDMKRDIKMLEKEKVDVLFHPSVKEVYPSVTNVTLRPVLRAVKMASSVTLSLSKGDIIPPKSLTDCLCGVFRPTHFQGVAQVVERLFYMVQPDRAYFGQKDYQQTVVIKWLVKKAGFDIDIRVLPTIREADGLAMSSRNVYLKPKERKKAVIVFQALKYAEKLFHDGERNPRIIEREISILINQNFLTNRNHGFKLQYAEIRDAKTLRPIREIKRTGVVTIAVVIGETRLIDNTILA